MWSIYIKASERDSALDKLLTHKIDMENDKEIEGIIFWKLVTKYEKLGLSTKIACNVANTVLDLCLNNGIDISSIKEI